MALTIAGSDPSGGAGIQADLKTFQQFGVYGEAVITLITVQNTRQVTRVEPLPAALVMEQIGAVLSDIPPAAAKTGALGSVEVVEAVAEFAASFPFPLVVDPVIISKHGARLVTPEAEKSMKEKLLPHAFLVTPNIPEAECLTGIAIHSQRDMIEAGRRLLEFGCRAALVKGGHLEGEAIDVLCDSESVREFPAPRVSTRHTHGTGCTYSAAITSGLALGMSLETAVQHAKTYIHRAIESAPGLGGGSGPVNHFAAIHERRPA